MARKKHKASGGRSIEVEGQSQGYGGGDPHVVHDAEEKKHGGRAKHKRKHGGKVDGKHPHHRMDRKRGGRVRGGRVGADTSPLSSAHGTSGEPKAPREQEGGLSK
jgi:hypothetical protein